MMKKVIAVAGGGLLLAALCGADVVSKNVGGYYTVKLHKGGWSMIGINWNAADGEGIPLQNLFKHEDLYPGTGAWDLDNCDQIALWDNDTQRYVGYFFFKTNELVAAKWYDVGFVETAAKFLPGTAFWFHRPSQNGTVSVKLPGMVDGRNNITFTLQQGYSMIAAGYPKERKVGELIEGYAGEGEWDFENCDILVVWDNDAKGYRNFYYVDIGEGPQWLDEGFAPVTQDFLLGQAGWYFRQAETPLVFEEPNPIAE